jgi:hypothetical protein
MESGEIRKAAAANKEFAEFLRDYFRREMI